MSISPLKLQTILPPVYKGFISSKIMSLDVTETKATCDNCLRARDRRFSFTYKKELKCCTFHPYLTNYAIGALLEQDEIQQQSTGAHQGISKNQGIQKIRNKIAEREFAFPIGMMAPFDYQYAFLTKSDDQFGNDENLLCPYYNRGQNRCDIWMFRGVVCTSFYCRSDYGQDGQKFWAVFSDYLSYVEMALAEECLVQMGFSPRDISDQLEFLNKREFEAEETEQKQISPAIDKSLWIGYDDKISFYKKCFAIVKNLDRNQFKEILGPQGLSLEKEVVEYANRRKN
ncbi:hypothetical protein [Pseudobdellovibrio exovorus]|uniref:Uncharacterized protein n=1 Tax=Pseudobdellovibrio exovorus JSS TaxID=1184267 RepID=M4V8N4_9BACT|nr:hypothetical protein [Pseudobdellovibrio exovorus]AGH95563.1 hypothetical protein A11Q_1347 [Pseudobdellovibrio exovorus JSS]